MSTAPTTARLAALARGLSGEGRHDDALAIFEHLLSLAPDDQALRLDEVRALAGKGETLAALGRLSALKVASADPEALLEDIRAQSLPAVERFNAHLAAGELELAETYAAALAELIPQGAPMLGAAFACNKALGRTDAALRYARALIGVDPGHAEARAFLVEHGAREADPSAMIAERMALALSAQADLHPLIRLRDLHDVASQILCRPLTPVGIGQLQTLLAAARALDAPTEPGSEWEGWEKHYRLLMAAVDMAAVQGPTPVAGPEGEIAFRTSAGAPLDWAALRHHADGLGTEAVFFAAADEAYVELYARWYALSVLKYSDVPSLVVIHVIGGLERLAEIAQKVGIDDPRVVFAGDRFDAAAALKTACYDAPPKGLIGKPVAHYQSIRFIRLSALLGCLARPVFVSDIDLILQRGVKDLLERTAPADVVFNENEQSWNAGSRLTANLLQVNPTPNAQRLLAFLRGYLEHALSGAEVTRWIDQMALVLGRHHLTLRGEAPQIAYFDTALDINNVMYPSYQENPFRFLSLFHGFDTSSLEGEAKVLGTGESGH
ncbi:hypothetical protein [Phenylobacterium aquaticum]|uniref:hypothetical protein n=1 Tax=Phenylobacterium aquaticum TaxID=1763816 RepID=UPI0026F11876|nr:hypothetical protein [Phenylobacterium aquaticum]